MTPTEFRRLGHQVIDWLADYRERASASPVSRPAAPGSLLEKLPAAPPAGPEGFDAVLRDMDELAEQHLVHWQHPSFFAYFPSNGDLSAVLGDLLSTGLGVLGLTWESAPALTELEDRVCDWLRQMSGLAPQWQGVIQDTASTCSMIALVAARERSTKHGATRAGMQHGEAPLVVYTSSEAHSSIQKAAMLAGFGADHVRSIDVDADRAVDVELLRAAVAADVRAGLRPCAIVATSGTTATTAFDPVDALAEVAERYGMWLHVDAAMAGSAMILPECRPLWSGVDRADSIVVNPHKWMGVSFDCSVFYVRDDEHLVRVMRTDPSYLRTSFDERVKTYRDWGVALGRRFRALKLWSLIRTHGTERIQRRLRRDLSNARWLAEQVAAAPQWRLLAPVPLQTLCIRHEPEGLDGEALDAHTQQWLDKVHATGEAWMTPARLDGRWMVRVSVGALDTEREHVAALWELLQAAVR
ncbi:MAG: aminotransferase class V-fold PLP-dependent enzyme [Planctomycetota bacterium]|nr:aminotransferase class V-fold PLP-dependent enzyme [Planctomycetota bacterium]MEC8252464.1 aminotransferase class V-fold PLP-dependent enzyme [Planctomycetota bacterium]MEC8652711.1 aminotransferase class V-fold PLP-dependent enzyme [Planctomycetota bacterium]MEC9048742.1 aminotransferase class V-fold PLP-dependent enzyme [Planctomycetota bacterium]